MILISPTRSLPSPRPIDTDPILNYRHIQPAAAAAAVGPWLCQHQQQHHSPPSSPTNNHNNNNIHHNIDIDNNNSNNNSNHSHHSIVTDSESNTFLHSPFNSLQHPPQQQPFTSYSSPKQPAPLLLSAHSPSSEISASPTPSTFSLSPSAHTTTTTNNNNNNNCNTTTISRSPLPQSKIPSNNSSPTAIIMLPQSNSDEESAPAEEEHKPSIKPCHLPSLSTSLNNTNNNPAPAPHQLDSHATSVSLYDLPPASSSAPTTSSSSSPFPSTHKNNTIPQQASYSSSPHLNQERHSNPHPHQQQHQHHHPESQFYKPSPPALHSPLHSAHLHHSQQQQQHPFDQRPPSSLYPHHHQSYPPCPQSAPPSASPISIDPHIMAAAASNVEVKKWDEENTFYYQVAYKGVTVGRLKGSGLVNGTKLLNLAGISRGKRDGILKNEKIRKVVKHGTMHLKGVWIAFDRAVFLAEQHNIADKIFPLLVVDLEQYVPIEQPMMAGGSKLGGPGSLLHHHNHHHHHGRHPRLLPQPIKFPHPALSLGPTSANSFSTGGWPSGPPSSTLLSIGFNEPFSAPPIPRSGETSSSIYEQAQFQYLNSTHSPNPDLLERRHTIPNNSTFHGYNSVPSFGTSQQQQPNTHTLTYPFAYNPAQLSGYPHCSSASESTPPTAFEYSPKNSLSGNGPNSPGSKN